MLIIMLFGMIFITSLEISENKTIISGMISCMIWYVHIYIYNIYVCMYVCVCVCDTVTVCVCVCVCVCRTSASAGRIIVKLNIDK